MHIALQLLQHTGKRNELHDTRVRCILKNMIIDFVGTEDILSLKYGFLLQNDKFPVCRVGKLNLWR